MITSLLRKTSTAISVPGVGATNPTRRRYAVGWRELQRPDLHLAPFDGATGGSFFTISKLKRDRTFRELGVLDIDCLDTIEHNRQLRAFGGDLIVVPFVAR